MHRTELQTMEFCCLHLSFCTVGFILTTEGQIRQCLLTHFSGNLSISSDISCEQTFIKEAWPVSKRAFPWLQHVVTSGKAA